jgi:ketosteroid isomerase-like protein
MKRTLPIATLVTACGAILTLTACQPAGPGANQPATANANTQIEKPLDTAAIEKELLQLEREWATAYVTRKVEAVKRIEADDITVTHPDGTTGTKADDVRDIETGALTAEGWEVADVKVRVLDADTAVITGRGIIKNGKYKGPDGRTQAIKPEYRFTDVVERRRGQWQVVASHSTTIENPTPTLATQASPSPRSSPTPTTSPSPTR